MMTRHHLYKKWSTMGTSVSEVLAIIYVENLSIYLWLYSPYGPWPLFQFLNLYTDGRTPWTGDQPTNTPHNTNRINAQRHPCFEWDSNPRFQCSSGRSRLMRPLRWAPMITTHNIVFKHPVTLTVRTKNAVSYMRTAPTRLGTTYTQPHATAKRVQAQ
jgi:hypothetical protein